MYSIYIAFCHRLLKISVDPLAHVAGRDALNNWQMTRRKRGKESKGVRSSLSDSGTKTSLLVLEKEPLCEPALHGLALEGLFSAFPLSFCAARQKSDL
jgi:hypothetical protein